MAPLRYRLTRRMLGYQLQPPPASPFLGLAPRGGGWLWPGALLSHFMTPKVSCFHLPSDWPVAVLASLTLSFQLFVLGLLEISQVALILGRLHNFSEPEVLSVELLIVYEALNLLGSWAGRLVFPTQALCPWRVGLLMWLGQRSCEGCTHNSATPEAKGLLQECGGA